MKVFFKISLLGSFSITVLAQLVFLYNALVLVCQLFVIEEIWDSCSVFELGSCQLDFFALGQTHHRGKLCTLFPDPQAKLKLALHLIAHLTL